MKHVAKPGAMSGAAFAMPQQCYLTVATSLKSLLRLEQGWKDLETSSHVAATVFQSFDWIKTWSEIYAKPESQMRMMVVAGYSNNRLVFVLPMSIDKMLGLNRGTWLSQPIAQYGDILCDKNEDPNQWMEFAVSFLKQTRAVDFLHLRHVRQTSNLFAFAQAHMKDGKLHERAPYLDLTAFQSDADYDARYDSRQRKHRKKVRKALEEIGPITFAQLGDEGEIDQAIDFAISEKRDWLKQRGRFNTTMACPKHSQFLKALARLDNHRATLLVTQLSAGEQRISWEASFAYRGIQYCYLTAHKSDFTNKSPGRLHFDLSQRHSLSNGIAAYDLMVPYDHYKESWSSAMEPVNDYYLSLNTAGAIVSNTYLGALRPLLRDIYSKLPVSILRILKTLLRV